MPETADGRYGLVSGERPCRRPLRGRHCGRGVLETGVCIGRRDRAQPGRPARAGRQGESQRGASVFGSALQNGAARPSGQATPDGTLASSPAWSGRGLRVPDRPSPPGEREGASRSGSSRRKPAEARRGEGHRRPRVRGARSTLPGCHETNSRQPDTTPVERGWVRAGQETRSPGQGGISSEEAQVSAKPPPLRRGRRTTPNPSVLGGGQPAQRSGGAAGARARFALVREVRGPERGGRRGESRGEVTASER